ncbi:MAG: carboxypeptidase regulatory-like domain-containing protein, partial [Bacteroidaceae bacterium]|nr:carboxypeptidase regulatory-like domain-containing protein [Bacteroidaceae bacterium]
MKMLRFLPIIVSMLAMMAFVSCSKDEDTPIVFKGSIYGVVVSTKGEAVKGVSVSLYRYNQLLLQTVTYDDGSYEFKDLNAGKYQIKVKDARHEGYSSNVTVEAGRQARADIKLTPISLHMTVTTLNAEVMGGLVILKGKYSSDYNTPDEYGFYYSKTNNPVVDGKKIIGTKTSESGDNYNFEVQIKDLDAGKYYFQAYARNSIGTGYGDVLTFEATSEPAVQTLNVTDIDVTSAILNGEVMYEGKPAYTERGFIYSANYLTPTISEGTVIKVSGSGEGTYQYKLMGLTKGTTYYVRTYVKNSAGTYYGGVVSFKCAGPEYVTLSFANLMIQIKDLGQSDWSGANT